MECTERRLAIGKGYIVLELFISYNEDNNFQPSDDINCFDLSCRVMMHTRTYTF